MIIGSCQIKLVAEWVSSLKEKRMIVKSIVEKTKHKFNVSVAEVDTQDMHQTITIGFVCVTNDAVHARQMIDNVLDFIENNTDAVLEWEEVEVITI